MRLFSVIKYESVIHEFDPYFNYRVSRSLTERGFYETWNFFDSFTWYPLGRVIGGTMYPGLIFTAGAIWNLLQSINIPIHIQEVGVVGGGGGEQGAGRPRRVSRPRACGSSAPPRPHSAPYPTPP